MAETRSRLPTISIWRWAMIALVSTGLLAGSVVIIRGLKSPPGWDRIDRDLAARYPRASRISAAELSTRLQGPHPPLLVDVRSAAEFAVSHLTGALRVEPGSSEVASTSLDDDIVVYCSVGERSSALAERLIERGYRHVADLHGGIFSWANHGYPVERNGDPVMGVHPCDSRWGRLLEQKRWQWQPE